MKNKSSPKGKYARKLPEANKPLNTKAGEAKLKILAEAMTEQSAGGDSAHLAAGYTYFGQFVDHDLTWNRDSLAPQQLSGDRIESIPKDNFRTSFLDLDHVYGDGPGSQRSGLLYCGDVGEEQFKIGKTVASPALNLLGDTPHDFEFDGDIPLLGDGFDHRNAENLIVRQIHVIFLKFHNAVIAKIPDHENDDDVPRPTYGTLFDRARLLVTWTYQWVVWFDFLQTVVKSSCFRQPQADAKVRGSAFKLPLEFALAAFRFGHSMVRDRYSLNSFHRFSPQDPTDIPLVDLINTDEKRAPRLKEDYVIEWPRFFNGMRAPADIVAQNARQIDTHITDVLRNLPEGTILRFAKATRKGEIHNLALRTLLRGARALLASGQQAWRVGDYPFTKQLADDKPLRDAGLTTNTPLWYYILKEAEVAEGSNDHAGESLGDVGSRIVCDTIEGALRHDKRSFLNFKPNWKPPCWIIPHEYESPIGQLIAFTAANALPQRRSC